MRLLMMVVWFCTLPLISGAVELTIVNHTGAPARIAHLFNVCQGSIVPYDAPVHLQDGEWKTFKVNLVMQHYKICGSGFCSSTSMQLKSNVNFVLEMVLDSAGVIEGIATPEEWGGPTNPCPEEGF